MKRDIIILTALLLIISCTACGKTLCSVEGCDVEAVEDSNFDKQFCADHLQEQYCSVDSCKEVATEDDTYTEQYCTNHLNDKKAFDISKMAYENITKAYTIAENFGDDIYDAWYTGIFNTSELYDQGGSYLVSELSVTEEELSQGVSYAFITAFGWDWDETDQATKEEYMEASGLHFLAVSLMDDISTFCVECITGTYKVTGKTEEAQLALEEAKTLMKQLAGEYADYEYYPDLKDYYTVTSAFLDFCAEPTGSFDQLRGTLNDYKNEARGYANDLDFIFED